MVSQPGKPRGRGNKSTPLPTPVEQVARDLGLPDEAILCPKTAKEVGQVRGGVRHGKDVGLPAQSGALRVGRGCETWQGSGPGSVVAIMCSKTAEDVGCGVVWWGTGGMWACLPDEAILCPKTA